MGLKLIGEIGLDGSGFQRGAQNIASTASETLKDALAGAFSVGAITELTKKTIEYAGHINDLADRLGVTTDYLQEMQYVTKQNGASVDDLTTLFEKLGAARQAALGGDLTAKNNFAKLGVTEGDLKTQSNTALVDTIAAQFKRLGNNDEIKSAFKEIGGKGAGALVPSFIDGIQEGRENARAAGAVISEDTLIKLDTIGDQFEQLGIRLMTGIAPSIIQFADALSYLADKIGQSQAALGEIIGNIAGSASDKEVAAQDARQKKFEDQTQARVDKGELSQAEANKKVNSTRAAGKLYSKADGDLFEGASQAAAGTLDEQSARAEQAAKDLAAKIADRKAASEAAPTFTAPVFTAAKKADSLVSVGNFLGGGKSALENIAKKQLDNLKSIDDTLKKMLIKEAKDLGLPSF